MNIICHQRDFLAVQAKAFHGRYGFCIACINYWGLNARKIFSIYLTTEHSIIPEPVRSLRILYTATEHSTILGSAWTFLNPMSGSWSLFSFRRSISAETRWRFALKRSKIWSICCSLWMPWKTWPGMQMVGSLDFSDWDDVQTGHLGDAVGKYQSTIHSTPEWFGDSRSVVVALSTFQRSNCNLRWSLAAKKKWTPPRSSSSRHHFTMLAPDPPTLSQRKHVALFKCLVHAKAIWYKSYRILEHDVSKP